MPGLSTQRTIRVSGVIFLSDGLHILLSTDDHSAVFMPYAVRRSGSFHSTAAMEAAIRERTDQIEALREELAPKLNSLKIDDADVRVWISRELVVEGLGIINSSQSAQRKLVYRTVSEEGQTYRQNGGGLGCGGYANVVGGNSAQASVAVSQLETKWSTDGIELAGDLNLTLDAQIAVHMNGPAGPRFYMQSNCISIFGHQMCTDLPSTTISCDSPIGGEAHGRTRGPRGELGT